MFVDLNRHFAQFDDQAVGEDVIVRSYAESQFYSRSTISWDDLLQKRLTVVLGEPGSGKTVEFRNRASVIQQDGEFAFFVRLESLIEEPLAAVLSQADEGRLAAWLRSDKTAIFLLDSADESKLRNQRDFESALERFAKDITAAGLQRSRIVLSSRVSEWRAIADASVIQRVFRIPDPKVRRDGEAVGDAPDDFWVLRLLPLDKEMVTQLLEGAQIERVSEIISEFDRCFLWPFVRRPIDALRYARALRDGSNLDSLTSILRHDIEERLRETHEREQRDLLTQAEAMDGAMTLAAAVIFTQRPAILVRDAVDDTGDAAIDAARCLDAGWTPPKVNSLLNRAVFDGASRGKIRFHHRSVTEFLAAGWLSERAALGCPIPNIEELLCAKLPDGRVIREGFQPILAWTACGETQLAARARECILDVAPDLFFSHGDAAALPLDYRQQLLEAYINQFARRQSRWTETDPESLARFGDASLALILIRIAEDQSLDEDARLMALWIARQAQITACLDTAIELAADSTETVHIRTTATAVVRDVGDSVHKRRLADEIQGLVRIPGKLIGILVECIFPAVVRAREVAILVQKVDASASEMRDSAHWLLSHFENKLDAANAIDLLSALLPLARQEPFVTLDGKPTRVSAEHGWLGQWFPELLDKSVAAIELDQHESQELASAWAWLEEFIECTDRFSSLPDRFADKTERHKHLRRSYFWRRVADYRLREGSEPRWAFQFLQFRGDGGFGPSPCEVEWLLEDIATLTDSSDRELALRVCFDVYLKEGRPRGVLRRMKKAVSDSASLQAVLRN